MDEERMTIGELAWTLGVSDDTIRRREASGELPKPKRTARNYRYYTMTDLDQIRGILFPEERGELVG